MKIKHTQSILIIILFSILAGGSLPVGSLFSGCYGTVTMARIGTAVRPTLAVLQMAQRLSTETNDSITSSYVALGDLLRSRGMESAQLTKMESSLFIMNQKADSLEFYLGEAVDNGTELFKLLRIRANQNETESFQDEMLEAIEAKEEEYEEKLETANRVLEQIRTSIQKYDDILGYLQVSCTTKQDYFDDINSVIADGTRLNREIQQAIQDGIAVVNSYQTESEFSD